MDLQTIYLFSKLEKEQKVQSNKKTSPSLHNLFQLSYGYLYLPATKMIWGPIKSSRKLINSQICDMGTLNTRLNACRLPLCALGIQIARGKHYLHLYLYVFLERDLKTQKYVLRVLQRFLLQFYCKFMRYVFLAMSIVNANTHIWKERSCHKMKVWSFPWDFSIFLDMSHLFPMKIFVN